MTPAPHGYTIDTSTGSVLDADGLPLTKAQLKERAVRLQRERAK